MVPSIAEENQESQLDCSKMVSSMTLPNSSTQFLAPMSFINCSNMFPTYGFVQCYMNNFYTGFPASGTMEGLQ